MLNFEQLLISILRTKLCDVELPEEIAEQIKTNPALLTSLYEVSDAHDLAHVVGEVLFERGMVDNSTERGRAFFAKRELAEYRYVQMDYDFQEICAAFEKAKIPYMPLKGSVLRNYYPEPAMRTSCDIDILVHPEDLDRATTLLKDELGYTIGEKYYYNISVYSQNDVLIELHFALTEEDKQFNNILSSVWDNVEREEGFNYRFRMTAEMFVLYEIIHMVRHFWGGGFGIHSVMDLWILKKEVLFSNEKLETLLRSCNLLTFGRTVLLLADVWFSGEKHTETTQNIADYIIGSGAYGTKSNQLILSERKSGGRFQYALKRWFAPYKELRITYPKLEKYPFLYPFYQVKRWFRLIFKDRRKAMKRLQSLSDLPKEQKRRIAKLCDDLEI